MGQLGQVIGVLAIFGERPYGMADPDHPVSRGGGDAGQQPRPPGAQRLPPGLPGDLAAEIAGPVSDPPRITQRVLPRRADRAAAARELLQPPHIPIQPPVHLAGVPTAHHRLSRHRPMVRQPPVELRPRGVQPLICLIKGSGPARSHHYLPRAPGPAGLRACVPKQRRPDPTR
jgi:hypothetical protein